MQRRTFLKTTTGAGAMLCLLNPDLLGAVARRTALGPEELFMTPPRSAGPWVVWHWTSANQTMAGVTSNLEGMAAAGIAGATLFSFPSGGSGSGGGTVIADPAEPLTPEWFELLHFAVREAERVGIELAVQITAGWATAGGEWITPEESQQQLVWSERQIEGGGTYRGTLTRPRRPDESGGHFQGGHDNPVGWDEYYRELAVLAVREPDDWGATHLNREVTFSASWAVDELQTVLDPANDRVCIDTTEAGYLQFAFAEPFTLRSVTVDSGSVNLPAHRLEVRASPDGITFERVGNLEPMMHGWQTRLARLTHSVPETTARYFRLVFHPAPPVNYDEHMVYATYKGSGFDLPTEMEKVELKRVIDPLRIVSVGLSSTACVHHREGKTALVWGKSRRVSDAELSPTACMSRDEMVDLSDRMAADGSISWEVPPGNWKLLRFGYTTMARTNGRGAGQGLEPDKLSRRGARAAFRGWYARILDAVGPKLAASTVTTLNVDSWECGSQNWSPVFRDEFTNRRGYDPLTFLPAMAGYPLDSADRTESFLFDVRRTIADLIADNFYGELRRLCRQQGSLLTTEVTNPTMASDGILAYKHVDIAAGEFWCDRWNCWKPHDIRDAASGAHVYGKQLVVAEAFTGGGDWKEHPYALKAMGDMHFADGINRMMIHLWAAQPYPGRVPGLAGATGLFYNEHTPWTRPGKAWIDYLRRCQLLLQEGTPVCDVLYFIGEDVPCRALIPPHYGSYFVTDPALPAGYAYDSINQDALLNLARVEAGRIVLPGGSTYAVLVMNRDCKISIALAEKLRSLIAAGARVVGGKPAGSIGLEGEPLASARIREIGEEVWGNLDGTARKAGKYGRGYLYHGLPMEEVMAQIGLAPDVSFLDLVDLRTGTPYVATAYQPDGINATAYGSERRGWGLLWNHRTREGEDVYFISNQEQFGLSAVISFRQSGRQPERWDPATGTVHKGPHYRFAGSRTLVPYTFQPAESFFIVFRRPAEDTRSVSRIDGGAGLSLRATESGFVGWADRDGSWTLTLGSGEQRSMRSRQVPPPETITGKWKVSFPLLTGTTLDARLAPGSWTDDGRAEIRYFSGTATYRKNFRLQADRLSATKRLFLDLGEVANLAEVWVNDEPLGVVWKPPYRLEVTDVVRAGINTLRVAVTNTWFNHLVRDAKLPEAARETWVASGLANGGVAAESPLSPAGLLGPVTLRSWSKVEPQ